jgi:hypothetical protein
MLSKQREITSEHENFWRLPAVRVILIIPLYRSMFESIKNYQFISTCRCAEKDKNNDTDVAAGSIR